MLKSIYFCVTLIRAIYTYMCVYTVTRKWIFFSLPAGDWLSSINPSINPHYLFWRKSKKYFGQKSFWFCVHSTYFKVQTAKCCVCWPFWGFLGNIFLLFVLQLWLWLLLSFNLQAEAPALYLYIKFRWDELSHTLGIKEPSKKDKWAQIGQQ